MRPKERRDSGQNDLFKARLDQIVDLGHPARAARRDDRLALSRGAVRRGLHGQAGPAAAADAADGGPVDPQAHARPVRRGALRTLPREPILSALL
jgi:hypothetical protein